MALNEGAVALAKTDTSQPDYYLKVVDCQYACPAHTNVPEYIRLIAQGKYTEAYLTNRRSNVFPGILGRVCDRPCEPACRRGRIDDEEPVAICRLKRVAADHKESLGSMFKPASKKLSKTVALIGAGPASLTVANDLLPLGYQVTLYEKENALGGAMRRAVPAFRLPESVLEEEIGYITSMGLKVKAGVAVTAVSELMNKYDAVFVGAGAPLGRDLNLPGRKEGADHIHVGLNWLAQVSFKHVTAIGKRVVVIGGGNTAMDCCRTALRIGAETVTVVAPEAYDKMLASPWEKEDAVSEGVAFCNHLLPKEYAVDEDGGLKQIVFDPIDRLFDDEGQWNPQKTGAPPEGIDCDDVILAIGQGTSFDFIDEASGIDFHKNGLPVVDKETFQSNVSKVFFGGDCSFGPKNIITAVADGHKAALSMKAFLEGRDAGDHPSWQVTLASQKMGLHEWSYGNSYSVDGRFQVPHEPMAERFKDLKTEVELGYDAKAAILEAGRCLNCDVQTVFEEPLCIECDSCIDICPTDCLTMTVGGTDEEVAARLTAERLEENQTMYQSGELKTKRVMVKDENVCLHCGLCAERCPTGAWDMQRFELKIPNAGEEGCG